MSSPRSEVKPFPEHPVLSQGFMWLRKVDVDESPWPGNLVRYPDGQVKLHVASGVIAKRDASFDYGDWCSDPHSYLAETLYRNQGAIDLVFPKCEISVRDFIANQNEHRLQLERGRDISEGQLVTIVLSILRTLERWAGRESEISGTWWLRHDGCPVFAFNSDELTLFSESLALIEHTSSLGGQEWHQFITNVVTELSSGRFDRSILNRWEEYLFSRWGSAPLFDDVKVHRDDYLHNELNQGSYRSQSSNKSRATPEIFLTDASLNDLISSILVRFLPSAWRRKQKNSNKDNGGALNHESTASKAVAEKPRRKFGLILSALFTFLCLFAIFIVLSLERGTSETGVSLNSHADIGVELESDRARIEQPPGSSVAESNIWDAAARNYFECKADHKSEQCAEYWSGAALSAIAALQITPEALQYSEEVDDYGGAKLVALINPDRDDHYLALLVSNSANNNSEDAEAETGWYVREIYQTPERPAS